MSRFDLVSEHIDNIKDYIAFICASRIIYNKCEDTHPKIMEKLDHSLNAMVNKYPHWGWDWQHLSANPDICWKTVEKNITKPWNWASLCSNPNMTWKFLMYHLGPDLDYRKLLMRDDVDWNVVCKTLDHPWSMYLVSRHIPYPDFVLTRINNGRWSYSGLMLNPHMTVNVISKIIDKISANELQKISFGVRWEIIEAFPHKDWNWWDVTQNPNITWNIISKNSHLPWHMGILSRHHIKKI